MRSPRSTRKDPRGSSSPRAARPARVSSSRFYPRWRRTLLRISTFNPLIYECPCSSRSSSKKPPAQPTLFLSPVSRTWPEYISSRKYMLCELYIGRTPRKGTRRTSAAVFFAHRERDTKCRATLVSPYARKEFPILYVTTILQSRLHSLSHVPSGQNGRDSLLPYANIKYSKSSFANYFWSN